MTIQLYDRIGDVLLTAGIFASKAYLAIALI